MSGFHSRWVSARRARSAASAGAAASARSTCAARCVVESGCLVPVRRSASWRGFSRKRCRAAAKACGSSPSSASYPSTVQTLSQTAAFGDARRGGDRLRPHPVDPASRSARGRGRRTPRAPSRPSIRTRGAARFRSGPPHRAPANATNGMPPTPPESSNSNASTESLTTAFSCTPLRSRSNGSPTQPRERQRRVERAAEVRALDAERRECRPRLAP